MTPAELLREAAKKLGETAGSAEQSRWTDIATQLAYLLNAMADELADGEALAVEDEAFAVARAILGGPR